MNDSPYKIEEIVKDPIKLSLWLNKENIISPSYGNLLDNPGFTLQPHHISSSKRTGRVLTHIKLPKFKIGNHITEGGIHGCNKAKTGFWIYPLVAEAIEALNPDVAPLSMQDIENTFKALKGKLNEQDGHVSQTKAVPVVTASHESPLVKDFTGSLENLLELVFGNPYISWETLFKVVGGSIDLGNGLPKHWNGIDHSDSFVVYNSTTEQASNHPGVIDGSWITTYQGQKKWNVQKCIVEYSKANNKLITDQKPDIKIDSVSSTSTYTLEEPPHYYYQKVVDAIKPYSEEGPLNTLTELQKYLVSQACWVKGNTIQTYDPNKLNDPDQFVTRECCAQIPPTTFGDANDDPITPELEKRIQRFLAFELSPEFYVRGKLSALLLGLQIFKNFNAWYDVKSYLQGK